MMTLILLRRPICN